MDTVVHDLVAASLLGCLAILIRIVLDLVQPKSLNDLNLDTLAKGPQRSGDRRNSELQTTKTELSRLSPWETYADYAGCPPYPASVIQKYSEDLMSNFYTNPHSDQAETPNIGTNKIQELRKRTLEMCSTNEGDYMCILTQGTTSGCSMLANLYPWGETGGVFAYLLDNHTSVIGIRAVAAKQGAHVVPVPSSQSSNASIMVESCLVNGSGDAEGVSAGNRLFAFPLESNFSGKRYDVSKIMDSLNATARNQSAGEWHVLLDASRACSSYPPNLSICRPHFVLISYYKIFGYPTGLGCLLVRRDVANILQKKYFGGGTIKAAVADQEFQVFKPAPECFEDGTPSFLSIPAVLYGFNWFYSSMKGFERVDKQACSVARDFAIGLMQLKHSNGLSICDVYGAWNEILEHTVEDYRHAQGPTVCFNLKGVDGQPIGCSTVDRIARMNNIRIRSGGLCNPGALREALEISVDEMMEWKDHGFSCGSATDIVKGRPTGVVRVSFGYGSTSKDVSRILIFLEENFRNNGIGVQKMPCRTEGRFWKFFIYPIKSCQGQSVTRWPLGTHGLLYDRMWKIVDANGCTIRLKTNPELANIQPRVCLQSNQLIIENLKTSHRISLSLVDPDYSAATSWLQNALNCVCYLVSSTAMKSTVVKVKGEEPMAQQSIKVGRNFLNKSHLLVVEKKSLEYLYQECHCPGENFDTFSLRFRPNIVVEADTRMTPFKEDKWEHMEINGVQVATKVGYCTRCDMIQINPITGEPTQESMLRRLAAVKKANGMNSLISFGVLFNINLDVCRSSEMNLHQDECVIFCSDGACLGRDCPH